MKKLVFLGLMFFGFFSSAATTECVPQAEMKEIAADFSQFRHLTKADFCYDGSDISNLISSIMFMRKTAFTADMPKSSDELFSGRFASSWYRYFTGRIKDIDVQASCPKGVGAYVYGFGNTMYVCPMLLTDNFSALDRASVFMHEARHIDGYPHITCSQGARKGLNGACDRRISDGGSYAVTVETYAQIAKYATDLHPALKAYSLASAVTYADETFETPARVERSEKLLLMGSNKSFFLLDPASPNTLTELGQTPDLGHLVPRAQHLILFPDDKILPARYVFTQNEGEILQAAGDAAMEYNSQSPAERAQLLDLHIAAQWSAKIYPGHITLSCNARSPETTELSLNDDQAVGLMYLNGYDRTLRLSYLMTANGKMYEFGCTERAQGFLRPSNTQLDQEYKRIQKVAGRLIGLTSEGTLFEITGSTSKPLETSINGQIHEIAPFQNFGFMEPTP